MTVTYVDIASVYRCIRCEYFQMSEVWQGRETAGDRFCMSDENFEVY
jgi:hypothetical protein